MRKAYYILLVLMVLTISCEFHFRPSGSYGEKSELDISRYDRLESTYLTTGDFSALQQMNTGYPMETRTLIEDVLKLGEVNDPEINSKFLNFYQDTILQSIVSDVEVEYANMDDVNKNMNDAFSKLNKLIPNFPMPHIYTQIGALDQSVVVGNQSIGISLDKYLGEKYPLYKKFYSADQRKMMNRQAIVPDCLNFYILSLYPLKNFETSSQLERDMHIGKIQWVANHVMKKKVFSNDYVKIVSFYMKNTDTTIAELLKDNDYSKIIKESGIDVKNASLRH